MTNPTLYQIPTINGGTTLVCRDDVVERIRDAYVRIICRWLKPSELIEVIRLNQTPEYRDSDSDACADFCDSNVAISEAFEKVMGRELCVGEDTPDMEELQQRNFSLANDAWYVFGR